MANWLDNTRNKIGNTIAKKSLFDDPNYNPNKKNKCSTLDLIKSKNYNNEYIKAWKLLKINVNNNQLIATNINNTKNGNIELYDKHVFKNTINIFLKILENETINNLEVLYNKEKINVFNFKDINQFLNIDQEKLKEIFSKLYLYPEIGIKIDVVNEFGEMKLTILEPYKYNKIDNKVIILNIENKEISKEIRILDTKENNIIYGDIKKTVKIKNAGFFTIKSFEDFDKKIESVLSYDSVDSQVTKEILINASKLFIDRKIVKKNIINDDVINLIDVPETISIDSKPNNGIIENVPSKNNISEILNGVISRANNLVQIFGLSKKSLGIDSGQDFASSLPYENDLTAKTINDLRLKMSNVFEEIFLNITGDNIKFEFEKYKLNSKESIININQKAINSNQMSIRESISERLDLDLDDEKVLYLTCLVKIDKSINMDFIEEQYAIKNNLLPFENEIDEVIDEEL